MFWCVGELFVFNPIVDGECATLVVEFFFDGIIYMSESFEYY